MIPRFNLKDVISIEHEASVNLEREVKCVKSAGVNLLFQWQVC